MLHVSHCCALHSAMFWCMFQHSAHQACLKKFTPTDVEISNGIQAASRLDAYESNWIERTCIPYPYCCTAQGGTAGASGVTSPGSWHSDPTEAMQPIAGQSQKVSVKGLTAAAAKKTSPKQVKASFAHELPKSQLH